MSRTLSIWRSAGRHVRRRIGAMLRPLFGALGFDVEERHYYSPIPRLDEIPHDFWRMPAPMPGVELNVQAGLELLAGPLREHIAGFAPDGRFYLDNHTYESVDAEVLYAMIRHVRPRRIVELGSGATSVLIAGAISDLPVDYCVFDPYPNRQWDSVIAQHRVEVHRISATRVPLDEFTTLEPRDILFVDTTHTVKIGGDVTRIVLEVLPALSSGVLVHFHDVFLPYHYPREWLEARRYWAEQYLLQAFLTFNREFEVVLATHAISREHGEELQEIVPSFGPGVAPGAFWIRRC